MLPTINEDYFQKYCEIASILLSRADKENPAIKSIIRYTVREAMNHATELPGHDNKLGARIISEKAYAQIKTGDFSGLIGEHVIPVSVVNGLLSQIPNPTVIEVSELITKFSTRAVITKQEDNKLKEHKLVKKMPSLWSGVSIWDRYDQASIKMVDKSYKAAIAEFK